MKPIPEMTARDLVVIAAQRTANESVANWLTRDEDGAWEQLARERYLPRLLDLHESREYEDSRLVAECADALRLIAVEAMIRHANTTGA